MIGAEPCSAWASFEAELLKRALAEAMRRLELAEAAIDSLLSLKKYKDEHGKDLHYTASRNGAWLGAETAAKRCITAVRAFCAS